MTPPNAKIFTAESDNQTYYLSGIEKSGSSYIAIICNVDTKEFKRINFNRIEKYLYI